MEKKYIALLCFIVFFSCEKITKKYESISLKDNILVAKKNDSKEIKNDCIIVDSVEMKTSEYNGTIFYTENTMRGKGVSELLINEKVDILNTDKSFFGSITLSNNVSGGFDINLPKKIIVREIIPNTEFRVFSFDSESPETDKDFLIIYINKEKKLIEKNRVKYNFSTWEKYIKSAYIQLNSNFSYIDEKELGYWYKIVQIKNDSMQIKSIPETDCDYVEYYKDVTRWIKWKDKNCKLIKFNFCY